METFFKANIKAKIGAGFVIAVLVFIGVQSLSNRSINSLLHSEQEMMSSSNLSKKVEAVELSMYAYENKITSFVLSGNNDFLENHERDINQATAFLLYILDAVKDPGQKQLIKRLDSLVREEINFNQLVLIKYNKIDPSDAVDLINTGKGKLLLYQVSKVATKIQDTEEANLNSLITKNDSFGNKVEQMDYTASIFALIIIAICIFILFRDINKRIKLEKELRIAQEKAQNLAIMKEQFMANMSHEIRTPMNAIIGFTDQLTKTSLDEKQGEYVKAVQSSGENLLNIVNDILDFSKIEAGMVRIEEIPFNLPGLLHSIQIMFFQKAMDKHCELNVHLSDDIPETVLGDPTRLTQILVNLVGNAIKFSHEGFIDIFVKQLKEDGTTTSIQFMVKDTGIGIPGEKIENIFERFIQANNDTTRKYGGTGLGLSIVKKLVELQGGKITVESAEGKGSTFKFIIPYKKATIPGTKKRETPKLTLNGKSTGNVRILVAEDNLLNQKLAALILKDWGFDFDIVKNGKDAIEKVKSERYDLILMDIQMPEMNGYDTTQVIRNELRQSLPIIAMTAHALPGEMEKCLGFGMTDYISKPIKEAELYELVSKYIHTKIAENDKDTKSNTHHGMDKIINLDYLSELSNGNADFVEEMIGIFLSENLEEIQKLENGIENNNYEIIREASHKMLTSIAFVGLNYSIEKEVSEMEQLAENNGNIEKIKELFSKVKYVCQQGANELKK